MKFIIHKEPITSLVLERRICFPRLSEAQKRSLPRRLSSQSKYGQKQRRKKIK